VKADFGHMMLSATVEAAADLDVQVLHRLIQLKALLRQPLAQLACQSARGRNSQLACIRSRARDDVDNGPRAGFSQANRMQRVVELWQIALADPANHEVLLDGRAEGLFVE